MANPLEELHIENFSLGLMQVSNPGVLPPGAALDVNNVECRMLPALSVWPGRTAIYSPVAAADGLGLFQFRTASGRYELLFARPNGANAEILRYDPAGPVLLGSMPGPVPIDGVMFPSWGILILGNGSGVKKYDGTTLADLAGTPPKGRFWAVKANRAFCAGIPGYPVRLAWCALNNPEDWSTVNDSGTWEFQNQAGEPITAIYSWKEKLYVWGRSWMDAFIGTGPDYFERVAVSSEAGCFSHFTVAEAGGALYWYGPGGIWELFPGTAPRLITRGVLDRMIADADPNRESLLVGGSDGVRYYLSLPGKTLDREVVFDARHRSFWVREGVTYSRYLWWRRP